MKNGYTLEYLKQDLQDLQNKLKCKPACVYHAYRDYTVSFVLAVLEHIPQYSTSIEQAPHLTQPQKNKTKYTCLKYLLAKKLGKSNADVIFGNSTLQLVAIADF